MQFVHFTDEVSAQEILATGELELSRMILNAVYAVKVGGRSVPHVQHSQTGREVAIVFEAEAPDTIFPEEVTWHRRIPLPIQNAHLVPVAEAVALLDGSASIPEDGIHHERDCICYGCSTYRETVLTH